jgi:hypothetical protein
MGRLIGSMSSGGVPAGGGRAVAGLTMGMSARGGGGLAGRCLAMSLRVAMFRVIIRAGNPLRRLSVRVARTRGGVVRRRGGGSRGDGRGLLPDRSALAAGGAER